MAKHWQPNPLACVLLSLVLPFFSPHALSNDADLCSKVFSQIKHNEPFLAQEMDDLAQLCRDDVAQSGTEYWQCVDGYLTARVYNTDNLILAGHVCVTAEQLSQTDGLN